MNNPKSIVRNLVINFKDGSNKKYRDIAGIEVMPAGFVYVQLKDSRSITDTEVKAETPRLWFNRDLIENLEIGQETIISGELEVLKYKKFMEHGIDMIHQNISNTSPPDLKDVEKKVANDKLVQIKSEQVARKANQKKRKG